MMNSTATGANNYLRGGVGGGLAGGLGPTAAAVDNKTIGHQFLDALPTSPKYYHNALPPTGALAVQPPGGGGVSSLLLGTSTGGSNHLPYIKNKSGGNIILFTS